MCAFSYGRMSRFALVTLTLTRWYWYKNLAWIFWGCTCVPKMKFLGQGFQRKTDRQTDATKRIIRPHQPVTSVVKARGWSNTASCIVEIRRCWWCGRDEVWGVIITTRMLSVSTDLPLTHPRAVAAAASDAE